MDKFKHYLQQQNWEQEEPSPKAWQGITQKLQAENVLPAYSKTKNGLVINMFKYAAAACLIGLAAVGAWYIVNKSAKEIIVKSNVPTKTEPSAQKIEPKLEQSTVPQELIKDIAKQRTVKLPKAITPSASTFTPKNNNTNYNNQLQEMENSFTQVIYLQKAKINQTPLFGESAAYYKDFTDRLTQMDKDEKLIKKDIVQLGLTPELMEQLINVYQQKLNVLKLLQAEIQKTNNRYKQNRTPADTLKTNFIEI